MAGPVNHVTPEFPPTLLIHGTADTTVPPLASIRMYEALVAAKVPVELHMYAEQPHAFDAQPAFGRQCAAEMLLFLDRYARPLRSVDARCARDAKTAVPLARLARSLPRSDAAGAGTHQVEAVVVGGEPVLARDAVEGASEIALEPRSTR